MRASGVLLPVSSLPSKYGIGGFSKEAYTFVDQLKKAGQKYWQLLPIGPTGYGDSPYQSFSAFAGNPYFIDLDTLKEEGLLEPGEYEDAMSGADPRYVDYERLYRTRYPILRKAYRRFCQKPEPDFDGFCRENRGWLEDYSLFMAIKEHFGQRSWDSWDEDIRLRRPEALESYEKTYTEEIGFYRFLQYKVFAQWKRLKAYANQLGIEIIGDIPVYVAFDSADSWAHPELFQFDGEKRPTQIAGCPPDAFAADGQLWGNPLYDWEYHEKTGFAWWIQRMKYCFTLYDVVRIDHFRGFDEYFSIPYGASTAAGGCWRKGPGTVFFDRIKEELGDAPIIAEDLGYVTEGVRRLVKYAGYPSMKVIEFGFDSREGGNYIPYTYDSNCVVYTGTHDNQTLQAWFDELPREEQQFAMDYLDMSEADRPQLHWKFIRLALGSVADTAIIPIQDYLGLGGEARMNRPSTLGQNWRWRLLPGEITDGLLEKIARTVRVYGR